MSAIKKLVFFMGLGIVLSLNAWSQCQCNLTVVSNSVTSYNVGPNYVICISAGLTYTGTINLNGGTLCNNGSVTKVNFNGGNFENYGQFVKTGNLSIQNSSNVIINNHSGATFRVIGNLDIQSSNVSVTTTFNLLEGKTIFDVTGSFNASKGILAISPKTKEKFFTEGVYVNIGKDFYVGGNAGLVMNIGQGTYFNVNKSATFDGKYNKTINNYGGVLNINSDFNIAGNGQSTGIFNLINTLKGSLVIKKSFNAAYNNGTVNITNYASMDVGTTWTQSKDVTTVLNYGKISITQDLNIEKGTFENNYMLSARDGDVKNGTFTNNYYANFTRDLITSNNSAVINNYAYILVNREFNNIATANLKVSSTLETARYYNLNNGVINGPTSIPDTISYARIIISGYSENKGYLNGNIIVFDQTLQYTNNNAGFGFDVVANTSRIGSGIIFASKLPITIGPPISNCLILNFLYWLDAHASYTSTCSNTGPLNLSAQFYKRVFSPLFGIFNIPLAANYVWSPTSSFPGPPANQQLTQSPTIVSPGVTTTYIVKVNYAGCLFSKSITVFDCNMYVPLKKELDGGYYNLNNNLLFVKYFGEYNSTTLNYKIYNYKNIIIHSNSLSPLTVTPNTTVFSGDNRYKFDFSAAGLSAGYYVLEISNEKNEKLFLRFKK